MTANMARFIRLKPMLSIAALAILLVPRLPAQQRVAPAALVDVPAGKAPPQLEQRPRYRIEPGDVVDLVLSLIHI